MNPTNVEWYEIWWVAPGKLPLLIRRTNGVSTQPWVPDGAWETYALAREAVRERENRYDRIVHVRRSFWAGGEVIDAAVVEKKEGP